MFDPWHLAGWMVVAMLAPFLFRKIVLWVFEGIRLYEIRYLVPIPGEVYRAPNGDKYEILERRGKIGRWTLVLRVGELTWLEDVPAFRRRMKAGRLRKILARERMESYRPVR